MSGIYAGRSTACRACCNCSGQLRVISVDRSAASSTVGSLPAPDMGTIDGTGDGDNRDRADDCGSLHLKITPRYVHPLITTIAPCSPPSRGKPYDLGCAWRSSELGGSENDGTVGPPKMIGCAP